MNEQYIIHSSMGGDVVLEHASSNKNPGNYGLKNTGRDKPIDYDEGKRIANWIKNNLDDVISEAESQIDNKLSSPNDFIDGAGRMFTVTISLGKDTLVKVGKSIPYDASKFRK